MGVGGPLGVRHLGVSSGKTGAPLHRPPAGLPWNLNPAPRLQHKDKVESTVCKVVHEETESTRTLLSCYIKSYLKLSLLHINEIRVFGQVEILLGTDSAAASKRNTEVLGGGAQSWRWPVPTGPCPGSGSLGLGRITHLIERVGVPAGPCSSQPPAAPGT